MDSIGGWFVRLDADLFGHVDRWHREMSIEGDLLEIGVFEGRSAVLLAYLTRAGEHLHVCDLFEDQEPTATTVADRGVYDNLQRAVFENNFLRFHGSLPIVHHCSSLTLQGRLQPGSFRVVHIDGSHLYEPVVADLALSRRLLVPGGVVVLDDWCTPRMPGVAAAIWSAVLSDGLRPFAFTGDKLYATWSGPAPAPDAVATWFGPDDNVESEPHRIADHDVVRLFRGEKRSVLEKEFERWAPPAVRPSITRLIARFRAGRRPGP